MSEEHPCGVGIDVVCKGTIVPVWCNRPCWESVYYRYPMAYDDDYLHILKQHVDGKDNVDGKEIRLLKERDFQDGRTFLQSIFIGDDNRVLFPYNDLAINASVARVDLAIQFTMESVIQRFKNETKLPTWVRKTTTNSRKNIKRVPNEILVDVEELKIWLKRCWGKSDYSTKFNELEKKIQSKKGIFIILNKEEEDKKSYATLWTGFDILGGNLDRYINKKSKVYFWELGCSASVPQNATCESTCSYRVRENKNPDNEYNIHDWLGCKHYNGIRDTLKSNLLPSEWDIFDFLEDDMKIIDTEYFQYRKGTNERIHGGGKFLFRWGLGTVRTNIKADATYKGYMGMFNWQYRTKYQTTIHELWHNIDFIAGKKFAEQWGKSDIYRRWFNWDKNNGREKAGYLYPIMSYIFEENLLGRTIEQEITNMYPNYQDCVDAFNYQNQLFTDREKELDEMEKEVENESDLKDVKRHQLKHLEEMLVFVEKKSGFHYLCDIFYLDRLANSQKRSYNGRIEWGTRDTYSNASNIPILLTSECFANIGSIKGTNRYGMEMIEEFLPETCRIYSRIVAFIKDTLCREGINRGRNR